MAPSASGPDSDGVTCFIPVRITGGEVERALARWVDTLSRLNRPLEVLLVDDGNAADVGERLSRFVETRPSVRLLRHEQRRGFGACLGTALAKSHQPLLLHVPLDELYSVKELQKVFEAMAWQDEQTGQRPVLVNGCRVRGPTPWVVRLAGGAWRLFCRVLLGLPLAPAPTWLGWRSTAIAYSLWTLFASPFHDPYSPIKLWRTEFLRRCPLQSHGDFALVELAAKATFLATLVDEVPVMATESFAVQPVAGENVWRDGWRVFCHPEFVQAPPAASAAGPSASMTVT